jgi:hypothetical protein
VTRRKGTGSNTPSIYCQCDEHDAGYTGAAQCMCAACNRAERLHIHDMAHFATRAQA